MITIDDIRAIALQLPGATERPSYGGRPSWRAGSRMFAWVREDPEALVVWVESVEDKEALIASAPDRFFTTDHYDGHPIVLVSLETVDARRSRRTDPRLLVPSSSGTIGQELPGGARPRLNEASEVIRP